MGTWEPVRFAGRDTMEEKMELGNFSVSLAVRDIAASRQFYEKLGFEVFGGDQAQNWLIMKSPSCVIGLFQGMFENNILTFNPGWDSDAQPLEGFADVREIQRQLKDSGVEVINETDESTTGPASFMISDPDGNISMEKESLLLENLSMAIAAKNSDGYVICQV